jgi:hypothetical protein
MTTVYEQMNFQDINDFLRLENDSHVAFYFAREWVKLANKNHLEWRYGVSFFACGRISIIRCRGLIA